MELREQIARAICGNRVVGDDRPWQQWTEEADAVLEVLAKQGPVAWLEKSPEYDAWFLAYSCNPKAETRPLYAAPGAQAADVQVLTDALNLCRFALEPYDDVKPRDWKTGRERLRIAHEIACAALAKVAPKQEGK